MCCWAIPALMGADQMGRGHVLGTSKVTPADMAKFAFAAPSRVWMCRGTVMARAPHPWKDGLCL